MIMATTGITITRIPTTRGTTTAPAAATTITTVTSTEGARRAVSRLALLVWLSPAFPVGGFAYSHGLEWAHEAGDVVDRDSLERWLSDLLACGAARNDEILFARDVRPMFDDDEL